MHILTTNISQMVSDRENIIIAIKQELLYPLSIFIYNVKVMHIMIARILETEI